MLTFVLLAFLAVTVVADENVYSCSEVFVVFNYTNSDNQYHPYNVSFTLTAPIKDYDTYVTLSDITYVSDFYNNIYCVDTNCYYLTDHRKIYIGNYSFAVAMDSTSYMHWVFPTSKVVSAVADQGGFSMINGDMFTVDQPCTDQLVNNHPGDHGTMCCKKFKPISVRTTNISSCTEFYSLTTIYTPNENYKVFDSTKVTYEIINNTVFMDAMLTQVVKYDYLVLFYSNGVSLGNGVSNNLFNTSFDISSPNSKYIIEYDQYIGGNDNDYKKVPIGRFQFINGVAMIDETTPFTPQNNCQYFPNTFIQVSDDYENKIATTKLCCSKFG